MTPTFFRSQRYFRSAESVTEGHPDKLCDRISDGILDAMLTQDPYARVACETQVTTGMVMVIGEITCDCYVEIPEIVREVIQEVGYTYPAYGFDYRNCGVVVSLKSQSPDISVGVTKSHEARRGQSSDKMDEIGAGDQGIMVGFACNETPELMPLPISLAHKLCHRLAHLRKSGTLAYLRPDGKSQVTVEYDKGIAKRVDTIIIAAQHNPEVDQSTIERDVIEHIIQPTIPRNMMDSDTKIHVNGTGRFVLGGPVADAGVTGRKIMVDSYGPAVSQGGGCFSGKDPTKVDRSAAYAARYAAKNVVAAGLADRFELQLCYSIGIARPLAISMETFGTSKVDEEIIAKLLDKHFDFRPEAIIENLDLRRPIYRALSAYGHFGRVDLSLPWEKTDKASILREEAGLGKA
ncbi:MAG: methionine adenosyltransferase [Chloroflexota bacterium]|nr:methionine adenosyltransferase [Chloroflexota bacterium]